MGRTSDPICLVRRHKVVNEAKVAQILNKHCHTPQTNLKSKGSFWIVFLKSLLFKIAKTFGKTCKNNNFFYQIFIM
jgi:hypothetical protein